MRKAGAGTLTLSSAGHSIGAVDVFSGGLIVNGSLAVENLLSVNIGATLGGTGNITGLLEVAGGGILAPGASGPGTLTLETLYLSATANLNSDLGPAGIVGGGVNDLLQVSGSVVLGGILNVADAGGFGAGSYRLINYGGTLTDNGLTFGTLPAGFDPANFAVQTSIAGQVNLILDETSVLFWDGSQTVANGAIDGGTGTWDNATTNWTNSSGGAQRTWNGRTAVFTGAAGTVTLWGKCEHARDAIHDHGLCRGCRRRADDHARSSSAAARRRRRERPDRCAA